MGKKPQASRKLSRILSSMSYQGQDTVDKRKILSQVSSDKKKILLNCQEKTTTEKFLIMITRIYNKRLCKYICKLNHPSGVSALP